MGNQMIKQNPEKMEKMKEKWKELPIEIFFNIFLFFSPTEFCRISEFNKTFYKFEKDEKTWKNFCQKEQGFHLIPKEILWKEYYIKNHLFNRNKGKLSSYVKTFHLLIHIKFY
jgi:hypothetical protein